MKKAALIRSIVPYFLLFVELSIASLPCALRQSPYGSVCVCNSTYCDYLDDVAPSGPDDFVLVSSSKGGLRFSMKKGKFPAAEDDDEKFVVEDYDDEESNKQERSYVPDKEPSVILRERQKRQVFSLFRENADAYQRTAKISVNRSRTYQEIVGFGGALTGSVSHILEQLPQSLQNHIYESFYSTQKGIGYNMMRLSIGGCDFDLSPWAYNEVPRNDPKLTNFTKLDDRDQLKVNQIKQLMQVADNDKIKFLASAWSPPPWMKTNGDWTGYSNLKTEFYQTWADYHLKFLELMKAKNIPIWAITTGNEPLNGVIGWFFVRFMSLGWTPSNQAVWLANNLGPTLRNSEFKDVKIFSNDDQRYTYPAWLNMMAESKKSSVSYLDGIAVHWYWDNVFGPGLIDDTHKRFKDKLLLNTESCVGDKPWETHGPELGSWERAVRYLTGYMQDLQHWFNGWIDWNIVLDERGGPNYVNNFVDAPVIVNTTSREEIYKQPMFYAIGHFSKFIPEGSIRIHTTKSYVNIETVAFQRPDGLISLVFFNSARASVDVTVSDSERGNIVIHIPASSVHTVVYK